jgi:hypothetical protein
MYKKLVGMMVVVLIMAAECFSGEWISKGIGGGGALFGPNINPNNPNDIFINCDMSDVFRSIDGGATWKVLNFRYIRGQDKMASIQYTSNPNILYGLNGEYLAKSVNGGLTWFNAPAASKLWIVYGVFSDFNNPSRLCFSDDTTIYLSDDGGATARAIYKTNSIHMAGAFFNGDQIFIATSVGLIISIDNGATFINSPIDGIPSNEAMISFTGAKENEIIRFFCVTWNISAIYPGVSGHYPENYKSIYRMDYNVLPRGWVKTTNGLGNAWMTFVSMCSTNNSIAYTAGSTSDGWYPSIFKTTNGGNNWDSVLNIWNNANIFTAWGGDKISGEEYAWGQWDWGASVVGFNVCASDPQRAIFTDWGWAHMTTNGGKWWKAIYVNPSDLNPTNQMIPHRKNYRGNGLEPTACYSLLWINQLDIFESATDIHGVKSGDGGISWFFPSGLPYNTTYEAIKHPTNNAIYAAVSEVHNIYMAPTYCEDENIDWGSGTVAVSTDSGSSWRHLPGLNWPIISLAIDPTNPNRMYASAVNSVNGGIYMSLNYQSSNPTWKRIPAHKRTQNHPFIVRVLKDGNLVCSYSARYINGVPTPSSGVFISGNQGRTWADRTPSGMKYYTRDVVIDPTDSTQKRWYAAVSQDDGGTSGLPGLYRTINRGTSWVRIATNLETAVSCTVDPGNSNVVYLTTRWEGLWYTTNALAYRPVFYPIVSYPFKYPVRVYFNPYSTNEIWVTSFGGGLLVGNTSMSRYMVSEENIIPQRNEDKVSTRYRGKK